MVNEGFCGPCQKMLADPDIPTEREGAPIHHTDGASFQQALDMGCHICTQSWAHFDKPGVLGRTNYYHSIHRDEEDEPEKLVLYIDHHTVSFNPEPVFHLQPWSIEHARMIATGYANKNSRAWLSNNTRSDQSFDFLLSRYERCLSHHQKCSRSNPGRDLPTRLLDVSREDAETICLVSQQSVLPGTRYATLSHCWGQSIPIKLTKSSETTLRRGLPVNRLPNTFQHAVSVARKVGIRYMWIDSLCIYQDSIDDWSLQAALMNDIYRGATLNIAATAATHSGVGLFYDRNPQEIEPFKVDVAWPVPESFQGESMTSSGSYLCFRHRPADELIDGAPLNLRAWVMQERLLSPRIVHYTSTQLYWECHEAFVSEVHQDQLPAERVDDFDWASRGLKLLLNCHNTADGNKDRANKERDEQRLYAAWDTFVSWYSKCALTYPEDKFVAFAGIARNFGAIVGDELIAGLWRSQFVQELCWAIFDDPGPCQNGPWLAPSWSWASHSGGVWYPLRADRQSRAVAELVHVNVQKQQSGALKSGILELRCRPIAAVWNAEEYEVAIVSDHGGGKLSGPVYFDWNPDVQSFGEGHHNIFIVVLQEETWTSSVLPTNAIYGLVLVSSEKEASTFRRVGMFDCNDSGGTDSAAAHIAARQKETKEQVITIM